MPPRLARLLVSIAVLSLVAGCAGPGQGITDKILAADSPIVRDVSLRPPNPWEGGKYEEVYVHVAPEATDAEVLDLWCHVIVPAGAAELPDGYVVMSWGDPVPVGRFMPVAICPKDGSAPYRGVDLSSFRVAQSPDLPSSIGRLGSVVFTAATIENIGDFTVRFNIRVIGPGADSVTLVRPVQWMRPRQTERVEAVWVAKPGADPGDVEVEVTASTWYIVQDQSWANIGGFVDGDVTCTTGSTDVPPQCSATNRFSFPFNVVQYVSITPATGMPEGQAAFTWLGANPTTVKPGETKPLDVTGLDTWWRESVEKMPDGFKSSSGGSLSVAQPEFDNPYPHG